MARRILGSSSARAHMAVLFILLTAVLGITWFNMAKAQSQASVLNAQFTPVTPAHDESGALQTVAEANQAHEHAYPDVVARVNDQPIFGRDLAVRETMLKQSLQPEMDETELQRLALNQLVQEEVLLQSAAAQGVAVSDAELIEEALQQRQLIEQFGSEEDKEFFARNAAQMGISEEQYATDPRVTEMYRRERILAIMKQRIVDTLPVEKRNDPEAGWQAVEQFVAQSGAQIEILLEQK